MTGSDERPLRLEEIVNFASRFRSWHYRAFELPFVSALRVMRAPKPLQARAWATDASLLNRSAVLRRYASVVVFEVRK